MNNPEFELRPSVRWFAEAMERELRANDHKGGWENDSPGALLVRLYQEADELSRAVHSDRPPTEVLEEAADVANFALMIADVVMKKAGISR